MILALLLISGLSLAAPSAELLQLFEQRYFEAYQPRFCGKNSQGFIEAAKANGILTDLSMIRIENKGFSGFGYVNAEYARDWNHRLDEPMVYERNWYFHVLVLDEDGMAYDFDFGITPEVLHLNDYFEKMWFDEAECDGREKARLGKPCVGRDRKMDEYEVQLYSSEGPSPLESEPQVMTLREFIENWSNLL